MPSQIFPMLFFPLWHKATLQSFRRRIFPFKSMKVAILIWVFWECCQFLNYRFLYACPTQIYKQGQTQHCKNGIVIRKVLILSARCKMPQQCTWSLYFTHKLIVITIKLQLAGQPAKHKQEVHIVRAFLLEKKSISSNMISRYSKREEEKTKCQLKLLTWNCW